MSDTRKVKVPRSLIEAHGSDKEAQSFFRQLEDRCIIGEMHGVDIVTGMAAASTYYLIDGLTKGVENRTQIDAASGTITAKTVGSYKVNITGSVTSNTASTVYYAKVFVNGTGADNLRAVVNPGAAANIGGFFITGILNLNNGDVVDLRIAAGTAGVTLTLNRVNVNITAQA